MSCPLSLRECCIDVLVDQLCFATVDDDLSSFSFVPTDDSEMMVAKLNDRGCLAAHTLNALLSPSTRVLNLRGNVIDSDSLDDAITSLQDCRLIDFSDGNIPSNAVWTRGPVVLEVIDFSGTYVHDDAVVTVVQRCRALRVLHLRRCEYVSDDALWAISASAHELTELDIAYCSRVTEAGVSDMRCNKLQVLELAGTAIAEDFFLAAPDLTKLNVKGLSDIGDSTIQSLVTGDRLTYLNMAEASISDSTLHHIAARGQQLTQLNLSWCEELTDAAIGQFCSVLPRLRVVKIKNIHVADVTLKALADTCPALQHLDVGRCAVSDPALLRVAECCLQLLHLTISWTSVTDTALETVLKNCRQLQHLCVEGCKSLTADLATYVPQHASRTLQHLDLSWVNAVSNSTVATILVAMESSSLTVIDYYGNAFTLENVPDMDT